MPIKYPRKYSPRYENINASAYSMSRITSNYHKKIGINKIKNNQPKKNNSIYNQNKYK